MKRPTDDSIVIFAFIVLIAFILVALFIAKVKGLELDAEANMSLITLLVGVVSGWLGKSAINKDKE